MREKLNLSELHAFFGPTIPIAAVTYLQTVGTETSMSELREQLTGMSALWKDFCKQQNILEPDSIYPAFTNDGSLVKRLRDNKPFFIAESDLQAAQFVLLLNLGHTQYAKLIQKERLESGSTGEQS